MQFQHFLSNFFFRREKVEKDATKNFSRERSTLSERVATPIDGLPLPPPPSTPFRVESLFAFLLQIFF